MAATRPDEARALAIRPSEALALPAGELWCEGLPLRETRLLSEEERASLLARLKRATRALARRRMFRTGVVSSGLNMQSSFFLMGGLCLAAVGTAVPAVHDWLRRKRLRRDLANARVVVIRNVKEPQDSVPESEVLPESGLKLLERGKPGAWRMTRR